MNSFYKRFSGRTFVKYFLSYLIIFTVLILGFFLIIRSQLTRHSFTQQSEKAKAQLDNIAEQLNDDLVYLSQVDTSLRNNVELIMSRHKKESTYRYQIFTELNQYASCTQLIRSIIYMPSPNADIISTQLLVTYEEGVFYIYNTVLHTEPLQFDPTPYFDASYGQLIFLSNETTEYLLYFPATASSSAYMFFYVLDTDDIQQQFKSLTSDEMPAIALIDSGKQIVTAVNESQLVPYIESLKLQNGIYNLEASSSMCVHTGVSKGYSMISLLSNDSLLHQINAAFASSYMTLLLLSITGFLLIFLAMRITYLPLHKLTQKLVSNSDSRKGFLEQLDQAFSEAKEQNQLLTEKLNNYRLSIQKSLLDSVVTAQRTNEIAPLPNIDQFFDTHSNNQIFAVRMFAPEHGLPIAELQAYFQKVLPAKGSCFLLDAKPDSGIFLINYIGNEQNKKEVLVELLNNFYEEEGYLSAISNGTSSVLDIPSLYENVIHASEYWNRRPVVDFQSLPPTSTSYAYPYDKLNQFLEHLKKYHFSEAKTLAKDLFQIVDNAILAGNNLPDFFTQCVLVDVLTNITSCMNESNIAFKTYCNLYYETLFLCRSCSYTEKADEIKNNTERLIDLYEQEIYNITLNPAHIKQLIDSSYCQPDFSIAVLADKFQVSIAYMSYLVKKELNQNFSDYLWTLRLKKATELLQTTSMSIDEISVAVGYFNPSSFRRKFKQETGLTPSQFRSQKSV